MVNETITNNEEYGIWVGVPMQARLRTELINGGRRSTMEGYFEAEVNSGTLHGVKRNYTQIHMPGTGGVTGSLEGFPSGEGIFLNGFVHPFVNIPAGQSRTIGLRWWCSDTPENLRTGSGLGYVQFLFGSIVQFQSRGFAYDITIT